MILLPPDLQRASLRSFWLALSIIALVLIGVVSLFHATRFLLWVAAVGVLLIPGVICPQILAWPYRAWNKLARIYAGFGETLLLRICFFTVLVPTGWAGSSLRLDRPRSERSLWLPRQNVPEVAYQELHGSQGRRVQKQSWVSHYISWSRCSKQMWLLALLPFLLLLSWLRSGEEEPALPENIYTLF